MKKSTPQQSRRQFLKHTGIAGMALAIPMCRGLSEVRTVENVGLQLYTLRNQMAEDFEGTLARVAQLGYKEMEFAGYFDNSARDVRRMLDSLGLTSPAAHIQLTAIRNNLQAEVDFAATLGQQYVVVPSLPANERTLADYQRHAELLNRAGEVCRRSGLMMGYHNHDFEFEETGGRVHYDVLLEETDPQLVAMELDLYWIRNAGVNPKNYFERYPGRFAMLHVKDMARNGSMVEVGRGTIDFPELFAYEDTAGFKHYFVEHDNPEDPMESVAYSINSVRSMVF